MEIKVKIIYKYRYRKLKVLFFSFVVLLPRGGKRQFRFLCIMYNAKFVTLYLKRIIRRPECSIQFHI